MKFSRYTTDPVLLRSGFRCVYCGRDLLGDLETFLSLVRDHVIPRCAGGPDGHDNRVASCCVCDRLKAGERIADLDAARAHIARKRRNMALWFYRLRAEVGRNEADAMPDGCPDETCECARA